MKKSVLLSLSIITQILILIILMFNLSVTSILCMIILFFYIFYTLKSAQEYYNEYKIEKNAVPIKKRLILKSIYQTSSISNPKKATSPILFSQYCFEDIETKEELTLMEESSIRKFDIDEEYEVEYYHETGKLLNMRLLVYHPRLKQKVFFDEYKHN